MVMLQTVECHFDGDMINNGLLPMGDGVDDDKDDGDDGDIGNNELSALGEVIDGNKDDNDDGDI